MSAFCRGCLIKYDEFIELLQFTEKNRRLYMYSTSIQVKQNDNTEFQLCKDCYFSMKLACKFKKQCRNSDKLIKNYLALREAGDNMDLSTYLKNKDSSLTFRFPVSIGNNTPANYKVKEDDNESVCTSIRNFITDIMHNEEILDTEARIIQEVMQEEPDILEDSLDSHWLQDDASIDTDFRLDFSISPFSTPRYLEAKTTPERPLDNITNGTQKPIELTKKLQRKTDLTQKLITGTENILCGKGIENENFDTTINKKGEEKHKYQFTNIRKSIESNEAIEEKIDITETLYTGTDTVYSIAKEEINYNCEDEISNQTVDMLLDSCNLPCPNHENINSTMYETKDRKARCTIDRNLEKALQKADKDIFALADVLASSSPDFAGITPASTPRIRDIIYGDNPNILNENGEPRVIKPEVVENNDVAEEHIDILQDFFKNKDDNCEENGTIEAISNEYGIQKIGEEQISLEDFYCKMCETKYLSLRGLKTHFAKYHKLQIIENIELKKKRYFKKQRTCDHCGKEYNDVRSFLKHLRTHMKLKNPKVICEHCRLQFTSKSKLETHIRCHGGTRKEHDEQKTGKRYLCTHCPAQFKYLGNYKIHVRRHTKDYSLRCNFCEKGFFRKYDLDIHVRSHTGERPFPCTRCEASFKRRDALTTHLKTHFNEKKFVCETCGAKFAANYRLNEHCKSQKCLRKKETESRQTKEEALRKSSKKNYLCAMCGVKFNTKSRLINHYKWENCHMNRKLKEEDNRISSSSYFNANSITNLSEELLVINSAKPQLDRSITYTGIIDPEWQKLIDICLKMKPKKNVRKRSICQAPRILRNNRQSSKKKVISNIEL